MKFAFVFVLVGYGTKAGLAPMHSWLPDAHSQAPAPVSAMFSGFLLNTALYCIMRFVPPVQHALGQDFASGLLIVFGTFSILVAAGFIVFQRDAKRLLAYHSVEHMGIITLGYALGPIGSFAALFHTLNHSVCKSLAFFAVGRLGQRYGSHDMHTISGALRADRLWGVSLLVSLLALIGVAPFSIFMSEYQLLRAAIGTGAWVTLVLFLAASGVVFLSALRHLIDMVFGAAGDHDRGRPDGTLAVPIVAVGGGASAGAWHLDAPAALGRHRQRGFRNRGSAMTHFVRTRNAVPVPAGEVPLLAVETFRREMLSAINRGERLLLLCGIAEEGRRDPAAGGHRRRRARRDRPLLDGRGGAYPALTPDCPRRSLFEREIHEQWGVDPQGHPWLKPVRFPRAGRRSARRSSTGSSGEEIHEVAVGPVHAGVIEPGHFRFNCHGERVIHLEISLGYQHRGIERALHGGPHTGSVHLAETIAGDTTAGHATAYCQLVEGLSGTQCPPRAHALRAVSIELERIANHIGDLGALAGDVGFLPAAAYCGRLRGDVLNLTALLCGSRLGRGWIRPGGVARDIATETLRRIAATPPRRRARHAQCGRSAVEIVFGPCPFREHRRVVAAGCRGARGRRPGRPRQRPRSRCTP